MTNETTERLQARVSVLEDRDREREDHVRKLAESTLVLLKKHTAQILRIDGHVDRLLEITKTLQRVVENLAGR